MRHTSPRRVATNSVLPRSASPPASSSTSFGSGTSWIATNVDLVGGGRLRDGRRRRRFLRGEHEGQQQDHHR
jgi:hypothetical protein